MPGCSGVESAFSLHSRAFSTRSLFLFLFSSRVRELHVWLKAAAGTQKVWFIEQ